MTNAIGRRWGRVAALAGLSWFVMTLTGVGVVDDSYIFLRYARNLANGLGPVFNVGERVEGYTSPLWLVVVRGLFCLDSDPANVIGYASAALGLGTIVLVERRSGLGALLVALNPAFVFWAWSGMDTALVCFFLTATVVTLTRHSLTTAATVCAGAAFAAACLARLDVIVLLPLIAFWVYRQTRSSPVMGTLRGPIAFVVPIAGVVVHTAWRWAYYGAWLPNTAEAKVGAGQGVLIEYGLMYLQPMAVALAPALLLVLFSKRSHRALALLLTAAWLSFVACVGGDFFPHVRFAMPLLPMLAALAEPEPHRTSLRFWAVPLLAVQILMLTGMYRNRGLEEVRLAHAWAETGRWLGRTLPPDATIATLVAGAVPYYADRQTIDLVGLTDRHIATQGKVASAAYVGHQRYDSDYVLARLPSVVVLPDSGRYSPARFADTRWPEYSGEEWRYVAALNDLVRQPRTRLLYEYRADRLPNGRYVEALWLR